MKEAANFLEAEEIHTLDALVYLVYGSEAVKPNERRRMFHSLSSTILKNNRFTAEEIEDLQQMEMDLIPHEREINGFLQLRMKLPNGYEITLGDYGRKTAGPEDNILHLQIRYCNLHFPAAFDRNIERGFSMAEARLLRDLIKQESQLDWLAEIYFIRFIDRVISRYKGGFHAE